MATTTPALHSDEQIVAVAEGLTLAIGTVEAAEQLRRIYGERRAAQALAPLAAPAPVRAMGVAAPTPTTGAILTLGHPRNRSRVSRAYGPAPRAGRTHWL